MKNGLFILLPALLTACQMAGSISEQSNGIYQVGAVSCPVCGGPSNAERLALEEANEFCSRKGQTAVTLNIQSGPFNNLGGGDADLTFRCAESFTVNDYGKCLDDATIALNEKYGSTAIEVVNRLVATNGAFGFSELSNQSYPSESEKDIILSFGSDYERCWDKAISVSSPEDQRILQIFINTALSLMADLSASKITFGEYAKQINLLSDNLASSVSEVEKAAIQRRQQEHAQRMNMIQNMQSSLKTTNCTSTVYGNTVNTNCR